METAVKFKGNSKRDENVEVLSKFYDKHAQNKKSINIGKMMEIFEDMGILVLDDPRLKEFMQFMSTKGGKLTKEEFIKAARITGDVVTKAITGSLSIPNFSELKNVLNKIYNICKNDDRGEMFPLLKSVSRMNVDAWQVALFTTRGRAAYFGSCEEKFTIQSSIKPIIYALALELLGVEEVLKIVGMTYHHGKITDIDTLNDKGIPKNANINAGGIALCSHIRHVGLKNKTKAQVFDYVLEFLRDLAGGKYVNFSNISYMSEKESLSKNKAIIFYLKTKKCLAENADIDDLYLYFATCSYEVTAQSLSVIGATIANYGINPITGKDVLKAETCKYTMAMMQYCTPSPSWLRDVGLPATKGGSGSFLLILPRLFAISFMAPRIDDYYCSYKAKSFCKAIALHYNLNIFNVKSSLETHIAEEGKSIKVVKPCPWHCYLYTIAACGAAVDLASMIPDDTKPCHTNLLGRNLLHDAAAAGNMQGVTFFMQACPHMLHKKDWLLKKDQLINIMFVQLKNEDNKVPLERLLQRIRGEGIVIEKDHRFHDFFVKARQLGEVGCFKEVALTYEEFYKLVEPKKKLISGCVTKRLKIEDFTEFSETVEAIYESLKSNITGQLSNEFPDLENVDINKWGVAICSIDGQRKFIGHSDFPFTMQNICKPLLLALVLKTVGVDVVNKYIAFQPNNVGDDITELNHTGRPFNSMANSGAIMLCAILTAISYKGQSASSIHEAYIQYLKEFISDEHIEFKASACISKQDSADELRCLSFGVTCSSPMPQGYDTMTCLDLYIKACSIEVTAESLSLVAATLANGGVHPLTEQRIISTEDIKEILAAMYSYGLYQFSGEGSFMIGQPMKSSSSGALILVVPDKMGVALYSPLLNEYQISERSYQFCKELVKKLKLHHFDRDGDTILKKFPSRREKSCVCEPFCELFSAAAANDTNKLLRLQENKADFYVTDFFGHTTLHIAAVKGSINAVMFLADNYPSLIPLKDKWGRTARTYANELKFYEIIAYLDHA